MFPCLQKKTKIEIPIKGTPVKLGPAIVTAAVSQVGLGELEANNAGVHVQKYAEAVGHRAPMLWCGAFSYWCYLEGCKALDVTPIVPFRKRGIRTRWAGRAKDLAWLIENHGGSRVPIEAAEPGDFVLWHRGVKNARTGHIAPLFTINPSHGRFSTLDGNKGVFPSKVQAHSGAFGEANLLGCYRLPIHLASV
jgi:hypothetical protein